MNDIEELIRGALADAEKSAPTVRPLAEYDLANRPDRQPRRWLVPVIASFATAAVVIAFTVLATTWTGTEGDHTVAPSPAPTDASAGKPLEIPTSSWRTGDGAMEALGSGRLIVSASGCLMLGPTVLVWPAGYTARVGSDGLVRVVSVAGEVIAVSGQRFSAGGGGVPAAEDWAVPGCVSAGEEVFAINEDLVPEPGLDTAVRSKWSGCARPMVVTPGWSDAVQDHSDPPRIRVEVGETVMATANGLCRSLSLTPTQQAYRESLRPVGEGSHELMAVASGRAVVEVSHAMCEGVSEPDCFGGIAQDGSVVVRVP